MSRRTKIPLSIRLTYYLRAFKGYLVAVVLVVGVSLVYIGNETISSDDLEIGVVRDIGMHTTSPYSIPTRIATLEISDGSVVQVVLPRHINAEKGTEIVLEVHRRLLWGGRVYTFSALATAKSNNAFNSDAGKAGAG